MSEPNCPDCGHPISRHEDFFCMTPSCYCNQGKSTAMAKHERDSLARQLEVAKKALNKLQQLDMDSRYLPEYSKMAKIVVNALAEIERIKEE